MAMHSGRAYAAVRLGGAVYLIGLGLWTWRSAHVGPAADGPGGRPATRTRLSPCTAGQRPQPQGGLDPSHPRPQFLDRHQPLAGQVLTLACAHALLVTAWLLGWTVLLGRTTQALRPAAAALGTRATAVVLLAMGIRSIA
ncbi:hypothetical protein [Streptomyces sp. MI02-7b]|uniref:hypothetical protein n=1 Tax=Streptomyces sp. MI02-7b TaxID=462941 RepID=UPI0029ADC631|nr:hypothetical protein [Streptomyces sp. MI02-7b]MDX3074030.1 hypothetical protein [Streptomyces sp. MI02-7b]